MGELAAAAGHANVVGAVDVLDEGFVERAGAGDGAAAGGRVCGFGLLEGVGGFWRKGWGVGVLGRLLVVVWKGGRGWNSGGVELDVRKVHWLRLVGDFERNVRVCGGGGLVDGLLEVLLEMLNLRTCGFVPVIVDLRGGLASLRLGLLAGRSCQVFIDWRMVMVLLVLFVGEFRRLWCMGVPAGTAVSRVQMSNANRNLRLSFDVVRLELAVVHDGVDLLRVNRRIVVDVLVYGLVARIVVLLLLAAGSRTCTSVA